jgi:diguanylate cyclase (GGDEF)-like protein
VRGVLWGCVVIVLLGLPALALASIELPIVPGFTWAYVTVYALTGLMTAVLLSQASLEPWSWSLTLLVAAYVYSALATIPFLLSFPGAFTSDSAPLLGSAPSAPWAFFLWQGGFLLMLLVSTLLRRRDLRREESEGAPRETARASRVGPGVGAAMAIGIAAAALLSITTLGAAGLLPDLLGTLAEEQETTAFRVLSWGVVVLGLVVLAAAIALARRDGELRVWLVPVVLLTTIQALQLPQSGRYHLGWYAPRLVGMLAATVLLVVLLVEVRRQTQSLAEERALTAVQRRHTGFDPLTGLVNRENLLGQLDGVTGEVSLGVVLLNINGMSDVNEAIGNRGGDEVLVGVRDRMLPAIRTDDVLARYGGDVFAVVRRSPQDEAEVQALANALTAALAEPFVLGGMQLVVSATVGAVFCDDHGRAHRDVVRLADAALKSARRSGRGATHLVHVGDGTEASTPRLAVELELRRALDEHRVFCDYQPVVVPSTRKVVAVEALARIRLADGGALPPVLFIPVAAEAGLLDRLTEQVLAMACDQAAAWAAAGTPLPVAINIAPTWVTAANVRLIESTLDERGLTASSLTLEITEDQAADLSVEELALLHELARRGMGLAIDDFGTGYASLASFRDVPSTVLKIDRSFVNGMLRSQANFDLVASMVELAHRFDKTVVAEGVETLDELAALAALRCDHVQGYLTGRPMPAEEIRLGLRAVVAPAEPTLTG